ncbi:amino acid ABC transporter substrate-binding protein [Bauldia litoralis]|uniref:General L-amino acid transport system substrate-binding protein n=1 Tax=Bauldia litoralis TaxID=665467 RepID=A0A1G6B2L8_9HYPH|nr:amino acid ABC transporter substrate-binding protein [Bauldia litoralis]SDB14884.1 general L-amino acid transport system substrate-binding protein [Bauldia litoralis]
MKQLMIPVIAGAMFSFAAGAASATTLEDVKAKGFLQCGVNTGLIGFAAPDDAGEWTGFDVDFCKAIAAAIFNDATKVKYTPLTAKDRFTALQSGEIDLLSRNTTWTMSRDTALGLAFGVVTYYDGQGFMVRKDAGITSALELSGAAVCVQTGTTTELNLADYFSRNNMELNPVVFEKVEEANAAYDANRCDAYTTDASGLYSTRLTLAAPDDHIILPEIISKEPLGPVVRQGDEEWFNIMKWVGFALLNAEELGVTQANVDEMMSSENQSVQRLLGKDGTFGEDIGLTTAWAADVLKAVGNYGEIFERNIGADSPLQIARGLNALWTKGGIQYAPPIR